MQDQPPEFEWKETYNIKKESKLIDKTPGIVIPSKHCLNLAAAVYLILYDRIAKLGALSKPDIQTIEELS